MDFLKLSQNKANLEQAANKLKEAQSANQLQQSSALPSMGDNKVSTSSIFNSDSTNSSSVSSDKLTEALSGFKTEDLDEAQKAQYELLAAFADIDGDEEVTEDELTGLDLTEDGQISQEDIDKIYEELGIGTDATVDELLDAIDNILNGGEADEIKGINASGKGINFNEETGEYSVTVEKWTGVAGENSSLYGIMSNAYSDLSAAQKSQVLGYIQEMNPDIKDVNLIYANQNIKLPVLEYDENGNITGYQGENNTNESNKNNSTNPSDSANGTPNAENKDTENPYKLNISNGKGSLKTDEGTITFEYGKYYFNGVSCKYDEKTGEITLENPKYTTNQYGRTYQLSNGSAIVYEKGKYYMNGSEMKNIHFDSENNALTFGVSNPENQQNNNAAPTRLSSTSALDSLDKNVYAKGWSATLEDGRTLRYDLDSNSYSVNGEPCEYNTATGDVTIKNQSQATTSEPESDFDPVAVAKEFYGATRSHWGTDEEVVNEILYSGKYTDNQILQIMDAFDSEYKGKSSGIEQSNVTMVEAIQKDYSGAQETAVLDALYTAAYNEASEKSPEIDATTRTLVSNLSVSDIINKYADNPEVLIAYQQVKQESNPSFSIVSELRDYGNNNKIQTVIDSLKKYAMA